MGRNVGIERVLGVSIVKRRSAPELTEKQPNIPLRRIKRSRGELRTELARQPRLVLLARPQRTARQAEGAVFFALQQQHVRMLVRVH